MLYFLYRSLAMSRRLTPFTSPQTSWAFETSTSWLKESGWVESQVNASCCKVTVLQNWFIQLVWKGIKMLILMKKANLSICYSSFSRLPWYCFTLFISDKYYNWRKGQFKSFSLCQHRSGEVFRAELWTKPWWLLPGLCLHRQRFWWWCSWFGLGWGSLRLVQNTHTRTHPFTQLFSVCVCCIYLFNTTVWV